jgi:hypothetical protein
VVNADDHATDLDGTVGDDARRRRLLALLAIDPARSPGARAGLAAGAVRDVGSGPANGNGRPDPRGLRVRLERVCAVSVSEAGVSGAGVTVMGTIDSGLAGQRDQLGATDELARRLEDLQLTTGEGPCLDAYAAGAPVLAADLAAESTRWLGFGPEALVAGAAAVFSLPLQVGAVRLGTLDLHRDRPGALTRTQFADALVLASLATETLLELVGDPEPSVDGQMGSAWPGPESMGWLPDVHAEVHQASGMVSGREHINVGEALLRIRAHAFAQGEPINQVARRIVDRNLVLDDPGADDPGADDPGDDGEPGGPGGERDP